MAFYRAVLREATGETVPIHLVAVEKNEPFSTGVWELSGDDAGASVVMAEGDRRGALRQRQGTGGRTWHRLLLIGEKNRQIEHKAVGWPFHISVFPKAVVSGYGNEWQICLEIIKDGVSQILFLSQISDTLQKRMLFPYCQRQWLFEYAKACILTYEEPRLNCVFSVAHSNCLCNLYSEGSLFVHLYVNFQFFYP